MVRILLSGCSGKMGKTISDLVTNFPELTIAAGIDKNISPREYPVFSNINECNVEVDVILDFSRPDALDDLLTFSFSKRLPLVLCTTGYNEEQLRVMKDNSSHIAIFRSANMSIGINVINNILKQISALLYENYDIEVIEMHHNQKVDAPSGTALLLAETIKNAIPSETDFIYGREGNAKRTETEIGIHAIRGGSIVGDHEILFAGQGEIISLKHTALSRDVFAIGALKACEFMAGKQKGFFSMDDVITKK